MVYLGFPQPNSVIIIKVLVWNIFSKKKQPSRDLIGRSVIGYIINTTMADQILQHHRMLYSSLLLRKLHIISYNLVKLNSPDVGRRFNVQKTKTKRYSGYSYQKNAVICGRVHFQVCTYRFKFSSLTNAQPATRYAVLTCGLLHSHCNAGF